MASSFVHDVFLSFRGEDTRKTFTGHLYRRLADSGIRTFRDDPELEKGEDIPTTLFREIEGCRISLIVFSENYASSRWCLDELVKIMECRKTLGQAVFPIFYHVEPSDVRHHSFSEAFVEHKAANRSAETVSSWIAALHEAANLSGFPLSTTPDRGEAEFISDIVDLVSRLLTDTYLHEVLYPVGIDSRVEEISKSLRVGAGDDVHMVGIWGMGGMGKTSVAKAIYNKFYRRFEGASFLADVGETAKQPNGRITLQETLLSDILRPTKIEVGNADRGIILIKQRLRMKKVLVIVDDVDHVHQLTALGMRHDSFGPGSRIIITTRDRHLLMLLKVDPDSIHLTREMNEAEALELFSWHAFQKYCPDAEFLELSRSVVTYCGGLPLALEVLGSFLFGKDVSEWKSTLKKLKKIPDQEIQKKLRISYDAIDDNQKNLFLDVSCFFIGMDKNHVINILKGCGLSAVIDISVLIQRCLLVVGEKNKLTMHNLLRDMGREVVREENPEDPEERSRLWRQEDVLHILTEKSGTKKIKGLALNLQRSRKKTFRIKAFTKMKKLKLLQLNYVELRGDYNCLSKDLRWLCWHGLSLKSIGTDFFNQGNLVSMDLQYSNLVRVWEHPRVLKKLKILNLSHSHDLTQSPDFSKLPNLEYLIMKGCKSLSKMHPSIGDVKRLALVNLKDCRMLEDLPKNFYNLRGIETLILSGCSRFENFVEDIGEMTSLKTLAVSGTAISQVPPYIGRLTNLNYSSVQGLVRLKLRFPDVPKNYFPHDYASLMYCNLEGSNVLNLPEPSGLSHLERPCFYNCTNLPASGDLPDHCTALAIIPNSNSSEASGQSILHGLTAMGDGAVCLPGNDFPKLFTYVRESDQVFFQVPQTNLQAFTVCVVCSRFDEDMSPSGVSIFVTNYTKRIRFVVKATPVTEITSHEVIWRVNLLNDKFNLEGDDFVKVEVAIGSGFRVKKTGVSLVWDPKLINGNTIECEPTSYKYFPSDADNQAGGHYYNMKPSSSSSSSPPLPSYSSSSLRWKYEVFLSFSEDTGRTFTDHLYAALDRAGVVTFRDAEGLRSGENISEELVRIIQGSRISLIVFSENYVDSGWCLDELVHIMEREREHLVWPIFYNVHPSEVRHLRHSFGKAFEKHEARETQDKISGWRSALRGVADLAGWDIKDYQSEADFIKEIVDEIFKCKNEGEGFLLVPCEASASRQCEPIPYENLRSDNDNQAGPSHDLSDEYRPLKRLKSVMQE